MNVRLTMAALPLAAVALTVLSATHRVHAAAPEGKTIQINAKRFHFDPDEVTLTKGEPVTIVLHGEDASHGLRVTELGLDLKVDKGATTQATITPDKPGDFVGHCSTFCGAGHGSMAITFHVEP